MFVNIVMSEEFVGKACGIMNEHQEVITVDSEPDQSIAIKACNPDISIVIEACAGSGKTWILISRIFRLLLSGIAPHEILAITFTR